MIEVVQASPAHVGPIATRMRAADVRECAAFGRSPRQALRTGLIGSTYCLTAKVDGSPHAMMGVSPISLVEGRGTPWMLGTDEIMRHGRELVAMGPRILSAMSASYRRLENHVSAENTAAIRLLRRWGFTVEDQPRLVGGLEFLPFWRTV